MIKVLKKSFLIFMALTIAIGTFGTVNIFAASEILGDANIYLPPVGKTMKIEYTVSGTSENIVWSVDTATNGVEIMEDGALIVTGDAVSGATFNVIASTQEGQLIAQKEVTILAKPETYSELFNRYYEDFEVYENDTNIVMKASPNRSAIKYAAQIGTTLPVGKEPNGNTYAKATGAYYWGTLATFELYPSYNSDQLYMNGSKVTTLEGRFMVENATSAEQSLMFYDNADLKLMYKASSDPNKANVYDFTTSSTAVIATVDIGEWFDLRVEFDHINVTYDVYLNNTKILSEKTLKNNLYIGVGNRGNGLYIGASVDDLAMYNGRLIVPEFPEMPEEVFLTDSRPEAVIDLNTSVMLGKYEIKNAAEFLGVTPDDGKITIQKGNTISGSVKSTQYNAEKSFSITTLDGLEYDFSNSGNIPSGTGVIDDGKLDLISKYAEFDLPDAKGRLLITFDLYNENASTVMDIVTDGATKSIPYPAAGNEGKKVTAVIDTLEDSYIVILGDEIVEEGTLASESINSIRISNGIIDNFVFTSMCKTNPFVFNPVIDGVVAVGQTVNTDYRYFSPWNKSKNSETVEWYISDTEFGQDEKVGDGPSFTPSDEQVNMWLKYAVKASDSEFESSIIKSAPVQIADVYSVVVSGDNIRTEIMDSLNVPYVFVITRYYSAGSLAKTKMNKVVFAGGTGEVLENSMTGYDGAAVILLYPDTLKPVSVQKTVGTVPADVQVSALADTVTALKAEVRNKKLYIAGKSDDLASVVIYGHNTSDILKEYGDVFEKEDVFIKTEDTGSIVYASNVSLKKNKETEITLPGLARGTYCAEIVTRGGESIKYLWMEKPEEILKNSEMIKDGFLDIIKLFSDKTTAENQWIFDEYKKLDQKQKEAIDKLIAGENYNIKKLDLLVCLMAYLNEAKLSGDVYTKLSTEFVKNNYDITKVDAICSDANLTATKDAIFTSGWTNAETFINTIYEKSILYGIYHVKNYKEADTFIKKLNNSVYTQSAYQDDICDLVAGTLYESITALETAIEGYTPSGGGDDGLQGDGSQGGGSVGGGASGGGAPPKKENVSSENDTTQIIAPVVNPVVKNAYSDVDEKHWANEAITYLKERNIINGMPDGSFIPDGNITRAEFVKIVCEAFMLKADTKASFDDVAESDWYADYVGNAGGAGIINGSDGKFFPNMAITREDAAIIVYRVIENARFSFEENEKIFKDADKISDYAKTGVALLYSTNLISGMEDGGFYPQNNMTRAECAKMIFNILMRYEV